MRLDLGTKDGVKSIRIGFTDQRLTAHGGLAVWTRFITERGLREQLRSVLPHEPTSPNAYDPCDTALGFIGGILCGADKLARVAHLAHDPAGAPRRAASTPTCAAIRATGLTNFLGGTLENAQAMAAHESPRTTKLYDRTGDGITLDEVERIAI